MDNIPHNPAASFDLATAMVLHNYDYATVDARALFVPNQTTVYYALDRMEAVRK